MSDLTWIRDMNDNPANEFPVEHTFEREIQRGSEGVVNSWTRNSTGELIAVKVVKSKRTLPIEADILTNLPLHDSIVTCLAVYDRIPMPDTMSIVLEYCPGDLYDLIWNAGWNKNQAVFSEHFMWAVFKQLLGAIAFLHEGKGCKDPLDAESWRPVVHRDVKQENILIRNLGTKDDWSDIVIKLADFGLSDWYDSATPDIEMGMGTVLYWPPENNMNNRGLTPTADVWAVGAIIHELAHLFEPVVDCELTKQEWFAEHNAYPYSELEDERTKMSYWHLYSPRKAWPINVDEHEPDARRNRPTPKYSDSLNECMMLALHMDKDERPGSGVLLARVEEANAQFLLHELNVECEKET